MRNKNKELLVMKFGGAALESAQTIKKISSIVYWAYQRNNLIVVVSAIKHITDRLHEAVSQIRNNDVVSALKQIDEIYAYHIDVLRGLDPTIQAFETEQKLKSLLDLLKLFIKKSSPMTLGEAQQDYIISFGERMSVHVVTHSFRYYKKVRSMAIDTTSLLATTNEFGRAKPLLGKSAQSMKKILTSCVQEHIVPVITGYVGHAEDGCVTTLGRGGSDLTATLIASLVRADKVILWKDVVGLFDKDPKTNPTAQILKATDYDTAINLAKAGAKILHPEAIEPVRKASIPVQIKSFLFPKAPGTMIGNVV